MAKLQSKRVLDFRKQGGKKGRNSGGLTPKQFRRVWKRSRKQKG